MASAGTAYRNYNSTDTTSLNLTSGPLPQPPSSWEREGYFFKEWNTSRDGSGTSCQPGDSIPISGVVYAIWYGDYIEAIKDSSGIEHPIKDIVSGYITSYTETDPIFSASAAAGITGTNITTWNNKQDALTFDGTYNASTNKAATVSTITTAINALDGGTIGTGSTTKTITSLSQSNGNVNATFSDIAFPVTSVNGSTGAVTITEGLEPLIGTTDNTTPSQVLAALQAGKQVYISHTDATYGVIAATYFDYSAAYGILLSNIITSEGWIFALSGKTTNNTWSLNLAIIPSATSDLTNDSGFVQVVTDTTNHIIKIG